MSRVGLLLRPVRKDADTPNMANLTVMWRSVAFFVVPNWFLPTDAENYDTIIVLDPCWIPSGNFPQKLCVWGMCTICPTLQNACSKWIWRFI